jgi:hypothetical protein
MPAHYKVPQKDFRFLGDLEGEDVGLFEIMSRGKLHDEIDVQIDLGTMFAWRLMGVVCS